VVVPADEPRELITLAELRERKDAEFFRKINEGLSTVELLGLTDTLRSFFPNR
jgi:4-hydroxy-4-methyl-2-oxoglutarate aldolase